MSRWFAHRSTKHCASKMPKILGRSSDVSVEIYCGDLLCSVPVEVAAEACCSSLLWRFSVEACSGGLLWNVAVVVCCGALLWNVAVEVCCGALLGRFAVEAPNPVRRHNEWKTFCKEVL